MTTTSPGYWMYETSGVLRPAVFAYFGGEPMSDEQIAALRAYLRQWINSPAWLGDKVAKLRAEVDNLTSREAIRKWLQIAEAEGIDPL